MSYAEAYFECDMAEQAAIDKQTKKKKLAALLDKYGESREAIDMNADIRDTMEYIWNDGDKLIDEVLEERRLARAYRLRNREESDALRLQQAISQKNNNKEEISQQTSVQKEDNADEDVIEEEENEVKNSDEFNMNKFVNVTVRPMIEEHENITNYPYLDTADKITIAIGANINDNPFTIQWYYKNTETGKLEKLDNDNPLHQKLICRELATLDKYKGRNFVARFFEDKTHLRMSDDDVEQEYQKRVKIAIDDVKSIISSYNKAHLKKRKIPDFEKMPTSLQKVLVDMSFNLGYAKFNWKDGYPNFWNALATHNMNKMRKESYRKGISQKRHNSIIKLLDNN